MTKHLRFLIVLLMTLVWSAGWAAESVYKTLSFPDNNQANNKKSSYSSTWTAKIGSDSWSIVNFNNNQWKKWKYIKCGNGNSASVATITNSNAFDDAITKVVVKASAITSTNVNSITLEVSSDKSFVKSNTETITLDKIQQGDLTFNVANPITNGYYRLNFDCKQGKASVQVDQVDYYIDDSKTSTTLTFPQQSLTYATDDFKTFTGQTATLTADGTELTGKTITYSKTGDEIFSSFDATNGTLALNGNVGTATVTATFDGSNDDTYASSSASYTITVKEVIKDIATLKEKLTTSYQYLTLKLTDAIVTYKSGTTLYLQDKTGGIYCSGSTTLNNNDKVNGLVNIRARVSNGQRTITQFTLDEGATIENNVEFTPEVVTLAQLNDNIDKYENMRVKVVAATATAAMNNNQTTITQDGASLVLYSKNTLNWDFVADDVLDIEGYPITYTTNSSNTLKELLVYKKSDVEINSSVVATTLSFDTTENAFKVFKGSEDSFTAPKAIVKDAAGEVVAGAKITYESNAPTIASVGENGNVTFGTEVGEATITANYAGDETHKPAKSIFYTITYSKVATEMAWSESSVSVNIGEVLSAPTLTLTANGKNILAGKTIQYSSSNENVAIIDASGEILIGDIDGSTTITATFAGDDTYAKASAEYTLNVIDPNKTDVTFDFTNPDVYGYAKPTDKTILSDGDELKSNEVVITNVKGGTTTTRFAIKNSGITFRVYTGAILTVEAPAGFAINRIDFTDDGTNKVDNFTFSTGELSSKTWTGLAKKLTMKVTTDQVFLESMIVNLVKVENVTLNESATNTIEAKVLANVTLNRTMQHGVWNTICLPFDVTVEQATAAFGEGVKIAQLDDTSTGTTLSFKNVDVIKASIPYLIKPTIAAPADGYKFEGVEITEAAVNPTKVETAGGLYFNGVYNMVDATTEVASGYNAAFLGKGNTVFGAQSGTNMKGFRAYFAIPTSVKASELRVVIDGTATSIKNINSEVVESNAPVYNLQGQRVDGNNLTPGIYVKAGKKFVVK